MQLDFGMILFLVILSVGSIVMGIVLGKRFTKIVEPKQSIQEVPNDPSTLEKLLCTPMPPPPTPPPIRKIEESLADKSKRVVDNQKKQVKKDFEDSLLHYISRGNYSFTSVCKSFNAMPKELTVKVLRKVIDEFEKANPTLKVEANFKYSAGYSSNIVVVNIVAKS